MRRLMWFVVASMAMGQGALRAEQEERIAVTGQGEAQAAFSQAEITASVSGTAELASDAIVKYRDAKRRALEALNGLGLETLSTREEGISITRAGGTNQQMQRAMMGQGVDVPKEEVEISEKLILVLGGVDAMNDEARIEVLGRIIDAAQDAGLVLGDASMQQMMRVQMGQQKVSGLVKFVLPDAEDLLKKAEQAAIQDARARAERLAGLAGVELGEVLSVSEGVAMGEGEQAVSWPWSFYLGDQQKKKSGKRRVLSHTYSSKPVTVAVSMEFAIKN